MGMVAAIDGSQKGRHQDVQVEVRRIPGRVLLADDRRRPRLSDRQRLADGGLRRGDRQAAVEAAARHGAEGPPVLADGKIYVGTESGKFFILRPHSDRAEILSEVEMPISKYSCCSSEGTPEQVLGGAAVSHGRVFFVSSDAVYAIGPKKAVALKGYAVDEPAEKGEGAPAWLQVEPTELVLKPGQTVKLHARLFDDKGRFLREDNAATWSLTG